MRLPRKLFCSVKTLTRALCSLAVALTLLLLYVKLVSVANIRSVYITTNSSYLPRPLAGQQPQIPPIPRPTEAVTPSLLNLPCSQDPEAVNSTSCPDCFRPSVRHFENMVTEIGFQARLTRDGPPNIFNVSSAVVQDLVIDYLIEPRLDCPYLLAVQASILGKREERDTVRSTWGSVAREQTWPNREINAKVKLLFVVASQPASEKGLEGVHTTMFQEVRSEAEQHQDILYINMDENYRNLTTKMLSAFKWVKDKCPCVKFVLKVDYDTFVNVPLLVDTLLNFEKRFEFSILGFVYTEQNYVFREGDWNIPKSIYPMASFPEYCSGCGYVLSYSALSKIVDAAPYLHILPVEDAFITGVMRRVTGCKLFSLGQLFTHYLDRHWNPCQMFQDSKILGTMVDKQKHTMIWESFVIGSCA